LENPVIIALVIAGIGITLLFLSLVLFYGLLVLLTRLFPARETPDAASSKEHVEERERVVAAHQAKVQAALVAVAIARAEAEQGIARPGIPPAGETAGTRDVSPWWALHHQREVAPKSPSWRTR
jgi:Na+-transporting methylmalonyl-CoA/oxaloacetate decarboxylase gamma subunit